MFHCTTEKLSKCHVLNTCACGLMKISTSTIKLNMHFGKAMKAFGKIRRLIDGRDGITPQTGIVLYKSLVRPHWEFSVAAWATVAEKGIQLLEALQA